MGDHRQAGTEMPSTFLNEINPPTHTHIHTQTVNRELAMNLIQTYTTHPIVTHSHFGVSLLLVQRVVNGPDSSSTLAQFNTHKTLVQREIVSDSILRKVKRSNMGIIIIIVAAKIIPSMLGCCPGNR